MLGTVAWRLGSAHLTRSPDTRFSIKARVIRTLSSGGIVIGMLIRVLARSIVEHISGENTEISFYVRTVRIIASLVEDMELLFAEQTVIA